MKETVVYLCEFFFTNFWHFLALLVLLSVVRGVRIYSRDRGNDRSGDKEE